MQKKPSSWKSKNWVQTVLFQQTLSVKQPDAVVSLFIPASDIRSTHQTNSISYLASDVINPMLNLPKHIAIIMDGNNRYAKARGLPKGQGHVAGKDALDPLVEHCLKIGVEVLTVFAFSSENWLRPPAEVALLMRLLRATIHEQMPRMNKYQVRLRFIGDRSQLDSSLQKLMAQAEEKTAHFQAMTLVIAISYGGQWDIANAAKKIALKVAQGELDVEDVTTQQLGEHIQLADAPDVDMLIRTGGEFRVSNFLLWQSAYAELFFTPTLWPEFTTNELDSMIEEFAQRQRRFGQTSEQIESKPT